MDIPARSSRFDLALAVLSLVTLGVRAVLLPTWSGILAALVLIALALVAIKSRPATRALTAFVAILAVASPLPLLWQLIMMLALIGYALLSRAEPSFAPGPKWRERGRIPWIATLAVGGVTPFALIAWVIVIEPDLSDVLAVFVPAGVPFAALVLGAAAFAIVNATLEELIWRGVIQDRLEVLVGPVAAIALQAISFGVQHAHGVPRGLVGVLLAGIWGAMLGVLRRHSGGVLAPVIAHVIADATIACIVLALAEE